MTILTLSTSIFITINFTISNTSYNTCVIIYVISIFTLSTSMLSSLCVTLRIFQTILNFRNTFKRIICNNITSLTLFTFIFIKFLFFTFINNIKSFSTIITKKIIFVLTFSTNICWCLIIVSFTIWYFFNFNTFRRRIKFKSL